MSKIGLHVLTGSRNNYGPFCESKPAVVVAVNEGGSLLEVKQKSGNHAITVFRDTTVYLERPSNLFDGTEQDAIIIANNLYPTLKSKWILNPADYYTITNEQGNTEQEFKLLVAYEKRICELAKQDDLRCTVMNLASGTPGDFELWKRVVTPFIVWAWQNGHVYGRHAYGIEGTGNLVDYDANGNWISNGNSDRPVKELLYLNSIGAFGGIIITEAGIDGGIGYGGDTRFVQQVTRYDQVLRPYRDIIGFGSWTVGNWNSNPNCQTALPSLSQYNIANPTQKWTPPIPPPPTTQCQPRVPYNREIWGVKKSAITLARFLEIAEQAYNLERSIMFSADDMGYAPNVPSNTVVLYNLPEIEKPAYLNFFAQYYPETIVKFEPQTTVQFQNWPCQTYTLTQIFGSGNYSAFGLPGHGGWDFPMPTGSNVFAVAAGTIYDIQNNPTGFGINIRILHANGIRTIYAHLSQTLVSIGQTISAGQRIGLSGNTGNSTGPHLHLEVRKDGQTYTDKEGNLWPFNIHSPTPFIKHLYIPPAGTQLMQGWLYSTNMLIGTDWEAVGSGNLNLRSQPNSTSTKLGVVPSNSYIEVINPTVNNGYVFCKAYAIPESPPTTFNTLFGLHGSSDPILATGELNVFQTARIELVKVLSNLNADNITQLAGALPNAKWIIRAFLDIGGRVITPQQFHNDTIGDVQRTFGRLGGKEVFIELHNEPNLTQENPLGGFPDGSKLNTWLLQLLQLYRNTLPNIKFLYPGLSPGPTIPNIRLDHKVFLDQTGPAIEAFDFLGVHTYWAVDYPMSSALTVVDEYRIRFPTKGIYITEASNNKILGLTPTQKGTEYLSFWNQLKTRGVKGVTYFIASSSNPAWSWNGGSGEVWLGTTIPQTVSQR